MRSILELPLNMDGIIGIEITGRNHGIFRILFWGKYD
jgi:hypothetical protein